ncbi:MAG: hypothetical protein C9356_01590 [Oleiphilus sp.]|nr:MAG: hypothetical protein C9356_01590 [Oleiphilus sp.]
MKIEIKSPFFKCEEDENVFFTRLYALPGFESVMGNGGSVYLILKNGSESVVVKQVQDICDFWNTKFKVLDE